MNAVGKPATPTAVGVTPDSIGTHSEFIPVELSARFLEHFSEFMYSSPQKAFEELVSNGWDALAQYVDIWIPPDLAASGATMAVLDNGESMDANGLRRLWHIASSEKRRTPVRGGRKVVGQFGIGKLATYVLARKLTYICKAADGKIRRVTMDYRSVDEKKEDGSDSLMRELQIPLFDVQESEVVEALEGVHGGDRILALIRDGVPHPGPLAQADEYGAADSLVAPPSPGTWTLVILSDLKPTGQELKLGILRRMLQSALPFRSAMAICVNGEQLASSKIEAPIVHEWRLGPDFPVKVFDFEERDAEDNPVTRSIPITFGTSPVPHVVLPGIGPVTGTITLFQNQISGGKSDDLGASNGYFVNVLGRLVNQSDASFGDKLLNHAALARFRMTVRADGLNAFLTTDREKFKDRKEVQVFRAFLRRCFNLARQLHDADASLTMPDGGDVLVKSLGVVSLNPLRNVVGDVLASDSVIPDIFDDSGVSDRQAQSRQWHERTSDNIRNALQEVKLEAGGDGPLVKFRLADNTIVVNKEHPFALEHSHSRAEKEMLRTIAMVNLLSDVYAINIGIPEESLQAVRNYRELLLRFHAMQNRRSGVHLAKLLLQTQYESDNSRLLEKAVADALGFLGYRVEEKAGPGEPEGIASAFTTPSGSEPTAADPNPPLYRFTYDAKSSKHKVAATGNINHAGLVEHRERYGADYALVVAPGFSDGAMVTRCIQQRITPITGHDLGRLLEYAVTYGAISLLKLREMFSFYDPDEVTRWVDSLGDYLAAQRPFTIDLFLRVLKSLEGRIPDELTASTVALRCREVFHVPGIKGQDVITLVKGLAEIVPDMIGVMNDKIMVNGTAEKLRDAIKIQLDTLHHEPAR